MRKPIYLSILSLGVALQLPAFAVVRERETPAPSPRESIVFVGAHPDDSEGFAGVAFLLAKDYDLHVVDLTRGELGLGAKGRDDGTTAKIRTAEERRACALLGATPHFLKECDGMAFASREAVEELVKLLKEIRPVAVFTHWPVDDHPDHVSCAAVVNRAVKTANVPVERYFFEVLESQTLNWSPLYSVDITSVIDRKLEMLRAYECQNANDSLAMEKREQAAKRGAERRPRTAYAETFTSLDGRPVAGGVLERLKETARLRTL